MTKTQSSLREKIVRQSGRFGWAIVSGISLLLFLLPGNYAPAGLAPSLWLAVMVGILLLFWLGLLLGVGLLLIRYLSFFQQIKGPLLFFGLFMISLRAFAYLQTFNNLIWPASQLLLMFSVWLFALIGAIPLVLSVYLWYQDRSVRLVAITLLAVVWLLVAYTRWRGPEQTLQAAILGILPAELFSLICFSQLIFVLAPFFFIGHSLRLLYREWTRADMLFTADHHPDPLVEKAT